MKTALLQCNPVTGDIAGNIERISQAVRRAGKVDLCVTPELALSGVAPGDFLSMNDFVEGCRKGLDILAARFVSGPDLLVGAPVVSVYEPSLLSNAAVYIHRGQWDVISRKVRPEASRDPDAEFFDRGVSLGIVNLAGWRLGIVLCEEDSNSSFWTVRGTGYMPLLDLISRGVDAIIHMRATPYVIGKRADHEAMLTHVAARHHIHLLSVNIVGGNDGLVFAGQSLALDPTGTVYARGQAFAEDTLIVDMATGTAPVATVGRSWQENVFGALVLGTRDFIHKCGREKALVSISGGIDSGLVLAIAVEALGAHNVSAVIMPSPETSPDAVAGALQLAHTLGVKVSVIRIDGLMAEYERAVAQTMKDFSLGVPDASRPQLQERIRGSIMTTLANRAEGLVLSTINKSEAAMGYCTLYGDTVGSLDGLLHIVRRHGRIPGRYRGSHQKPGLRSGPLAEPGPQGPLPGIHAQKVALVQELAPDAGSALRRARRGFGRPSGSQAKAPPDRSAPKAKRRAPARVRHGVQAPPGAAALVRERQALWPLLDSSPGRPFQSALILLQGSQG